MQPTITPPKTFKLKTHLVFTTIEIKKGRFLGNFKASFFYGLDNKTMTGKVIEGFDLKDCVKNIENFLDCQIDERHYIIK